MHITIIFIIIHRIFALIVVHRVRIIIEIVDFFELLKLENWLETVIKWKNSYFIEDGVSMEKGLILGLILSLLFLILNLLFLFFDLKFLQMLSSMRKFNNFSFLLINLKAPVRILSSEIE